MSSLEEDQKLISFLEALGEDTDVDFAKQILVEHNWDLEAALTTVTGGDAAPLGSGGTPAAGPDAVDEEGYRAPMRTGYRETLIGPEPHELAWQRAADAAARGGHVWNPDGQGVASGDEGATDVRRAIQASAAEYSRVADQHEQGAIAQAIEASYGAHVAQEQHRFASATAAEREEQEMIARAIEASYREQSMQDARYRTEVEQASAASLCPGQDGGVGHGVRNSGFGPRPASGVGPTAAPRASANIDIRQPVPAPLPVPRTVSAGSGLHVSPVERRGLTSRSPATDAASASTNRVPMPAPRSTNASGAAMHSLPRRSTRPLDGAPTVSAHTGSPAPVSQSSQPTRSQASVSSKQSDRTPTAGAGPRNTGPPRPPGQIPITPPKPEGSTVAAASGLPSSSRSRSPMGAPPISRPRPALPSARSDPPESIRRAPPRLSDGLRPQEIGGAPGQSAAMREAAEAERKWRDADRDISDPVGYASRSSALLAQRRQANEQERQRRAAKESERQRREAEEAERQREERRAAEAGAERERRRAAEETERRRRLEEEACRQAAAERHRQEEEEAARQRAADAAAEEETRRTAAAAAVAAEQEAERRRRAQEQARRLEEAERQRREEETAKRQKQEADAAEQEAKRLAAREAEELRKEREEAEARQREAERAAQPEEKEKEVNEVVQALVALRRNYKDKDPKGLLTCLQTLRAYINNLAKNPQEPKFQRINCDNAAFRTRVASFEGAVNVLCACGFKEAEGALAVDPSFLKSKGPRLWDALAKVDVMVDQVKGATKA